MIMWALFIFAYTIKLDINMHTVTNKREKLIPMSRITPNKKNEEMDTVAFHANNFERRRAFDVLMEAQHYWNEMEQFRKDSGKATLL